MTPDPTCPRCNGSFVEIIDESSPLHLHDDDDDDGPLGGLHGDAFPGFIFRTGAGGVAGGAQPPMGFAQGSGAPLQAGLGGLLMALAQGAARPGSNTNPQSPTSPASQTNRTSRDGQQDNSNRPDGQTNTTRSGATSFGPFGLQWNVQYGSGGDDPYMRSARTQAEQNQRAQQQAPPTLSNFLRFAFGGGDSDPSTSSDQNPSQNQERRGEDDEEPYFHDDGMGGAGGAADGRDFNHDNRGRYHQPPQSPDSSRTAGANQELPPELAALRNLFTGLFGEGGAGGGSLLDILASGAHGGGGGPRGQWGDYVLGQQGLDDIISQLMEQTQGSNAPPPAEEDVIKGLERFTLKDKERISKAKNTDCPTCTDDFLASTGEQESAKAQETGEDDKQQEELMSMPCGHIYHEDCLVPWLRLHGTCPVCRISIAKPSESGQSGPATDTANTNTDGTTNAADEESTASEPRPTNPFAAFMNPFASFSTSSTETETLMGGRVRVTEDGRGTRTEVWQTQPPSSTTVTSSAGGMNSIVSSPRIVSDREEDEFFSGSDAQRGNMRETLRRAAEARMNSENNDGQHRQGQGQRREGGGGSGAHVSLEPDELD